MKTKNLFRRRLTAAALCLMMLLSPALPSFADGWEHIHSWSDAYSIDSEYHWRACLSNGCSIYDPRLMAGFGKHDFGPTDSETVCRVCGNSRSYIQNYVRPVGAAFLYGPDVKPGNNTQGIEYTGMGYNIISYSWDPDFKGIFRQNRGYTLTVTLMASFNYCFDSGFSTVFYNDQECYPYITYSEDLTGDESRFRYAHLYIYFHTDESAVTGLSAKTTGMNKVQLDWVYDNKADGYLVLRNGHQIGYTTTGSFTDTSADSTAYNYYWVIPYSVQDGVLNKGILSNYVYALGRTVSRVQNVKAVAKRVSKVGAGIELSWDAAEGANRYVIYNRTGKTGMPSYLDETNYLVYPSVGNYMDLEFFWVYGIYVDSSGRILCAGPMSNYAWAVRTHLQLE